MEIGIFLCCHCLVIFLVDPLGPAVDTPTPRILILNKNTPRHYEQLVACLNLLIISCRWLFITLWHLHFANLRVVERLRGRLVDEAEPGLVERVVRDVFMGSQIKTSNQKNDLNSLLLERTQVDRYLTVVVNTHFFITETRVLIPYASEVCL